MKKVLVINFFFFVNVRVNTKDYKLKHLYPQPNLPIFIFHTEQKHFCEAAPWN